ncbi:cytochrome P450 [Byssothecium circinans]|uniref:Cytochrome P450 n=1 Tax=Byssothecium circinans TaxID=147558 RepID=A0A6A5TZE7_9PLEO|nr:cytochrome P450 [Byssothecium circinans]
MYKSPPVYYLAIVLAAYIVGWAVYTTFFHPLRNVPGPFLAKFTELWRTRRYFLGQWHDDIVELHREYGPVVRIAPNETKWYNVWDMPGASKGVSLGTSSTLRTTLTRTKFFAATDVKVHAFLRKRVSNAYTMSTILNLEPQIQALADGVWDRFRSFAKHGTPVNMQTWTGYFAFDVVTKLGVGSELGFVEQGKDIEGIIGSIHGFFYLNAFMGNIPGHMAYTRGQAHLFRWLSKIITERLGQEDARNPKDRQRDMLDTFVSMKEPDGSPVGFPGVIIEGGNLIGAGADTTSTSICVVLGYLLRHPHDYACVQREVDEAYVKNSLSKPGELNYRLAEKIPFLNACIKEATRLIPSIVWQLPRETPAEGVTIADHFIPLGSTVSTSPMSQNRYKEIFGGDANKWRPERWLVCEKGSTAEQIRDIEKYNVTFGYSSRTCIRRNLAIVELHKFVDQFAR